MMMTMSQMRESWQDQIREYDKVIEFLEREAANGIENAGLGKPSREWMGLLHVWRSELETLLVKYPEESDAHRT